MRIAGHTMATPHLEPREAIELFGNLGIDGIEIICRDDYKCGISLDSTEKSTKDLLDFASSHNIQIAAVTPYITELNSIDFKIREREKENMKKCIRLANHLNCKIIRAYGGSYFLAEGERKYQEKKKVFIECMTELGKYAEDFDVSLAIENHFNTLTFDAQRTVCIVSEIKNSAVGILYDQANLGIVGAEEYEEAITMQRPYITHVHVKDFIFKGSDKTFHSSQVTKMNESERNVIFKVVGEGIVPWPEIIKLLNNIGYNGFLSLEYPYWAHPGDLPVAEIGIKKSKDYLCNLLKS